MAHGEPSPERSSKNRKKADLSKPEGESQMTDDCTCPECMAAVRGYVAVLKLSMRRMAMAISEAERLIEAGQIGAANEVAQAILAGGRSNSTSSASLPGAGKRSSPNLGPIARDRGSPAAGDPDT